MELILKDDEKGKHQGKGKIFKTILMSKYNGAIVMLTSVKELYFYSRCFFENARKEIQKLLFVTPNNI